MSRLERAEAVLRAAEHWKERCLLGGGSVFWDDKKLWTEENFRELLNCPPEDQGDRKAEGVRVQGVTGDKLRMWLARASADVRRLATEVRWLEWLADDPDVSLKLKIEALKKMWKWLEEPFPDHHQLLDNAVLAGVVPGHMTRHRGYEYFFLFERMATWFTLDLDQRRHLVTAPEEFARWLRSGKYAEGRHLPNVLCYLLFPGSLSPSRLPTSQKIARGVAQSRGITASPGSYDVNEALTDLFIDRNRFIRIHSVFKSRKNLILQGPPGTGKTFMARRLAWCLIGRKDSRPIEMVQFHQSYAYEDFVQGYRPTETGGFDLRNGVFHEFCERARCDEDTPYVFIIDEINRGNMSRIFGELLMLIEADKRTEEYAASLTYGRPGEKFFVPPNVYILGMMNTADRSLAVVDYALRRRFAFEGMTPAFDSTKFKKYILAQQVDREVVDRILKRITKLNGKIRDDTELGPGFEIGHSYFVPNDPGEITDTWYRDVVETQIAPLLREYWFEEQNKADQAVEDLLA